VSNRVIPTGEPPVSCELIISDNNGSTDIVRSEGFARARARISPHIIPWFPRLDWTDIDGSRDTWRGTSLFESLARSLSFSRRADSDERSNLSPSLAKYAIRGMAILITVLSPVESIYTEIDCNF